MALKKQEIEAFVRQYLGYVIEQVPQRKVLEQKILKNVLSYSKETQYKNIRALQSEIAILIDMYTGDYGVLSFEEPLGDNLKLEDILEAPELVSPEPPSLEDHKRTKNLLSFIRKTIGPDRYYSMLSHFNGKENLVELVSNSRLELDELASKVDASQLAYLFSLPKPALQEFTKYLVYRQKENAQNPITRLSIETFPTINFVYKNWDSQKYTLRDWFLGAGFETLMRREGGTKKLQKKIEIGQRLFKWPRLFTSNMYHLEKSIEKALFAIPGFEQATQNKDRDAQMDILNGFVMETPSLVAHFLNNGEGFFYSEAVDPFGILAPQKMGSPLAWLEFYAQRKGLDWFDRSQEKYIQKWRLRGYGLGKSKSDSEEFALFAIEDALKSLPGYGPQRNQQVLAINELFYRKKAAMDFFRNAGLNFLLFETVDLNLDLMASPLSLIEYYASKRELDWFDQGAQPHIDLPHIRMRYKWSRANTSTPLALRMIDDVLNTIPGFKEANGRRDNQLIALNTFLREHPDLLGYFHKHGLKSLVDNFFNPQGKGYAGKSRSATTVLEFYSEQKGLHYFDRTKPIYLEAWRIWNKTKWQQGEQSREIALHAIHDVLSTLPNYRAAEATGNRDKQVSIINQFAGVEGDMQAFFSRQGLEGLLGQFVVPEEPLGIQKRRSPLALLEWYDAQKGFSWFDRSQPTYLRKWRITEKNMWKQGQQSVQLALDALHDMLSEIPGYKEAEDLGNRSKQMRALEKLILHVGEMGKYLTYTGLTGYRYLRTANNRRMVRPASPRGYFKFYSDKKGLDWFKPHPQGYLSIGSRKELIVVFPDSLSEEAPKQRYRRAV